jgi:hypothetical protein
VAHEDSNPQKQDRPPYGTKGWQGGDVNPRPPKVPQPQPPTERRKPKESR